MGPRPFFACALSIAVVIGSACDPAPRPGDPIPGLDPAEREAFERGRAIFEREFTPETGLGPLFNAQSCAACHNVPATGGAGDAEEVHAARTDSTACDLLFAQGGPVYQLQVTPALRAALGLDREPVPANADTAIRSSPDLFGMGLLDAVPDSVILARADPGDADGDGISGRPNRFLDGRIGRFGRKAFVPTLLEFNAGAFPIEQGVTVPQSPDEGTVGGMPLPPGVDPLPEPELDSTAVRDVDAFVRFLAPPAPAAPTSTTRRGAQVFERIGCAACHVPTLRTGESPVAALANRDVAAYTDLLLHDMGPALADICFGEAAPSEFRTEPLMGLRFATRFLHDGRASTIEDAVRAHAGEGTAARDAFAALSKRDRAALLAFLRSL